MKYFFSFLFLLSSAWAYAQNNYVGDNSISPLASYSKQWNDTKYSTCNTAVNEVNLTKSEKEVIYILNLIRSYPALFTETVLKKYPAMSGKYYLEEDTFYFLSLVNTLEKLKPLNILYPDNNCFISAKCHAYYSGITSYVGHERKTKDCQTKKYYSAECSSYGQKQPLDIILSLLIDRGITSLGHRTACLNNYAKIGVSTQPHKKYGSNTVLDFHY